MLKASRLVACVLTLSLGSSRIADGQDVAHSFHDLTGTIARGAMLTVVQRDGAVRTGRFDALSDSWIRISNAERYTLEAPESSVASITIERHRKARGALMGFIAGAVGGVAAVAATDDCSPPKWCIGPSKDVVLPFAALFFGGIGAATGTVIGASVSTRQLLYLAPAASK